MSAPVSKRDAFAVDRRQAPLRAAASAPNGGSPRSPRFTRDEIIARIHEWARVHGEPPTIRDWDPSRARRSGQPWREERFKTGDWPSVGMVKRQFGTFNAAVQAAGLTPREGPSRVKRHLTGPEQILCAVVEWTKRYGEPPTQADWDPVRARRFGQRWRIVRYREGDWPSLNTVLYHFGSLSEAVGAAGLRPRRPGDHAHDGTERRIHNLRAVAEIGAGPEANAGAPALARQVEAVAGARRVTDQERLRMALLELASVSIRWARDIAWRAE